MEQKHMSHLQRWWRIAALVLAGAFILGVMLVPQAAYAGTTGNITGTVTDASGKPVADVAVTAASLSQTGRGTTDAHGFYSIVNLAADTYTVSFQKQGLQSISVPGVTVFQDQTVTVNEQMRTELKTIASVRSSGGSNLVKSNQGSNVYTITGQQLTAATNPVDTHETLYQWMAVTPGVTANGFPAQPRIRGGQVTDLGYEFEGIPIQDRIVGFFTSNLSNIGINNLEVYTGGLAGAGAMNGTGYFNSVLKSGTYPGYTDLAIQASSPEANQYLTFESGWATPDHRWSAYVGFDGVNSTNQYDYGEHTYPNVLMWGFNGPGPVRTRDWVSNFHYRPNQKDDFQFVATNSNGEFDFNYLLTRSPGEPTPLSFLPCPGAVAGATMTGATGGTAPNGQACPEGLYWGALSSGQGNIWHHYGGLGKIQWNHNINEHSFFDLRVAENFNQYIFDQPMADPNIPSLENPGGGWNWANDVLGIPGGCPNYPYAAGTPVAEPTGDPFDVCAFFDGVEVFYGDRRSNIWIGSGDYENQISDRVNFKAGLSTERDNNVFQYYLTNGFTTMPNGSLVFPNIYETSTYPTNQQIAYADAELHFGKLMIDPGVTYGQRHYGFPADQGYATTACPTGETCTPTNGSSQSVINPTFNGTYTFDPDNVVRFSYGDSTSFISSAYVYTSSLGDVLRNPFKPNTTFQPQLDHSADLMWEHNFGNNTTMRVGPYYNSTNNYYSTYKPFLGYFVGGNTNGQTCTAGTANCVPVFSKVAVLTNNNRHHTTGLEFGLNHVNNNLNGTSYWIAATYDNFWTSAFNISGAFINSPLPDNITQQGILIRSSSNPLWSATFLADVHRDRFHLDPLVYYQGDTFFNTGVTCSKLNGVKVAPYICQNEQIAHGWWRANLTAYEELGPKRNVIIGFKADNLFDQVTDTQPCTSDGTGCFPFDGPQSGIVTAPGTLIYQNYSQSPRTFYFFLGTKM
jgi:hypothetical protein